MRAAELGVGAPGRDGGEEETGQVDPDASLRALHGSRT